jgi:uncharacterized protein YjbI with pentapeptide repeats
LSLFNLCNIKFSGADLTRADFSDAYMFGAAMTRACRLYADQVRADLTKDDHKPGPGQNPAP